MHSLPAEYERDRPDEQHEVQVWYLEGRGGICTHAQGLAGVGAQLGGDDVSSG